MTNNNEALIGLTSIARCKAFCRKHNVISKDEVEFVSGQPSYIKKWLLNGVGTPYAKVLNCDVEEALREARININELSDLDLEEAKLFLEYCYTAM